MTAHSTGGSVICFAESLFWPSASDQTFRIARLSQERKSGSLPRLAHKPPSRKRTLPRSATGGWRTFGGLAFPNYGGRPTPRAKRRVEATVEATT